MFNLAHSVAMASAGLGCTYIALSQSSESNLQERASAYVLTTMSGSLMVIASSLMFRNVANVEERRTAHLAEIIGIALVSVGSSLFFSEISTLLSGRNIN